jgi:ATP synthase protein I
MVKIMPVQPKVTSLDLQTPGASLTDEVLEDEFKPLTAQQAQEWRQKNRTTSPWWVVGLQAAVAVVVSLLTWLIGRRTGWALSVAWGGFAVVAPAALFARALARQMQLGQPGAALVGLFVWEFVKVVLTVALLLVAPQVISELSWLALVAGFVVTMKVYWLAMALGWMQRSRS